MGLRLEKNTYLEIHRIQWFGHNLFPKLEPYPLLEFLYLTPALFLYSLFYMLKYRCRIDVIHGHGLNADLIAKFLAKFFKKRAVVSTHAIYNLHKRPFLAKAVKWVLFSIDTILALSKKSRKELMTIGLPENKIKVYTYWVDQKVFKPLDKDKCKIKLGWKNKFVILFVGRFIEIKGIRLLIEAAKRFDGINNMIFSFIGEGPLENEVRKASELLKNVVYVGRVENKNLNVYYSAADIAIVPSLYEEGFGRVILEALSCGTPVIASNRGGIPEVLNSSIGVLIEPTVECIARKIKNFYEHPNRLSELDRNCRKYAIERFSEKNANIIEESYYNLKKN